MYIATVTKKPFKLKQFTFKVGDEVRILDLKYLFQRDYQQKRAKEVLKSEKRDCLCIN